MINNAGSGKHKGLALSLVFGIQMTAAFVLPPLQPAFCQPTGPTAGRPLKRLRQQMRQQQRQNNQSGPQVYSAGYPGVQPTPFAQAAPPPNFAVPAPLTTPLADTPADSGKKNDEDKKQEKKHKKGAVRGDAPCLCWQQAGVPTRAIVVCVHGLGLNSSSYEQFGKRLSPKGAVVYAIDVRGFGSWMQAQGKEDVDFKACLADLKSTLEWVRRANPGIPVFLLGESMGGAIALQATSQYPELVDGLISACASGDRFQQKRTDLKVALHMLMPKRDFNIGSQIVDQATDKEELRQEWTEDPLNRMKLSAVELLQFQKFMNENHDAAKLIKKTPVLMVQGSADGLVKPEGTKELFDELATADKQWLLVPNAEHLIFEEGQFTDEVLAGLAQWMMSHAPNPAQNRPAAVAAAIEQAKQALAAQQLPAAISAVESAKQMSPNDPEIYFLIGTIQMKLNHPLRAKQAFAKAVRLGKGSDIARDSNRMLMQLPKDIVAPAMSGPVPPKLMKRIAALQRQLPAGQLQAFPGPPAGALAGSMPGSFPGEFTAAGPMANQGQRMSPGAVPGQPGTIALGRGRGGRGQASALGAPMGRGGWGPVAQGPATVLVFNAKWCEPCKDMSSVVEQAQQRVGNSVQFTIIDVDDPANEEIVEKYDIGPIPTTVFINPDGSVADFEIGYSGVDGLIKGLSKIRR